MKFIFFSTVLLVAGLALSSCANGDGIEARIMSIHAIDGEAVRMSRGGEAETRATPGSMLHSGYTVSTGMDSFCFILLDTASLLKMDFHSRITVEQATDRLLAIVVENGQVLVDVQGQAPGHEMETRIGNTVVGVRGTLFIAGHYAGGEAVIIVLEGDVVVNGVPLFAGYVMRVFDGIDNLYDIVTLQEAELDDFALQAILDNRERVIADGALTVEEIEEINRSFFQQGDLEVQGPQEERLEEDEEEEADLPPQDMGIAIGDTIRFGSYYWRVLTVEGNRALIITEYVIDQKAFHSIRVPVTWAESDLRHFLNTEFLNRMDPADRARIHAAYVINDDNPWFGTPGGQNTTDHIFLLSIDEVLRFFGDSGQLANRDHPDNRGNAVFDRYNQARAATGLDGSRSRWTLRSPGNFPNRHAGVPDGGNLHIGGGIVEAPGGLRPALWLYI